MDLLPLANVSAPRNNFGLAKGASHHLLVAGGIGVTPILAMARELETAGASFSVHYCARSITAAPLLEELRAVCGVHRSAAGGGVPYARRTLGRS